MKEINFIARDGKSIVCRLWDEVEAPKAVVQIVHGMKEYGARYDEFARFMNKKGYIVFADDHRSHGKTASSLDNIGKTEGEKDLFMTTVLDELDISKMLKKQFAVPVLIFGHGYGSFITQKYMQLSRLHAGVCLCGSAKVPMFLTIAGTLSANIGSFFHGQDKPAKLIEALTFERCDKKIKDGTLWTTCDREECEKYKKDPYTRNIFTFGFYRSFFGTLRILYRKKDVQRIDKSIPVFIISGSEDAAGGCGKYSYALCRMYQALSIQKLYFKLYPGARHDLLNEINREEVQNDILKFYDERIEDIE